MVYKQLIQNIELQKENFGTEHHFYDGVLKYTFYKKNMSIH